MRSLWAAALLVVTSGCADEPPGQVCSGETPCPGQRIPPPPQPQIWAMELIPQPHASLAATELPTVTFANDPPRVTLERQVNIAGTVEHEPDADLIAAATLRAVLTIPSTIPSHADRVFEGVGSVRGGRSFEFSLQLPVGALGAGARMTILPDPPLDRSLPPWTTVVARVASEIVIAAPRAAEMWAIDGTLQNAVGEPVAGYAARALVRGTTVSTIAVTAATGRFRLEIPRSGRSIAAVERVQVQLSPADAGNQRPYLVVEGVTEAAGSLGMLRLPSDMPALQTFLVPVTAGGKRAAGAILGFRTVVPGAVGGAAVFRRQAVTASRSEKLGKATVDLLPGTPSAPREYSVAVIPPANAPYGVHCRPRYTVLAGGGAPTGATIEVPLKVELSGSVVSSEGSALGDVRISANRIPVAADEACNTTLLSPPSSALSAKDGTFRLLLDPDRPYRIEYRPPSNSRSPTLVEEVTLSAAGRRRVTLPAGVLLEGVARGPDDLPVAGCDVRALDAGIDGTMEERGRARTGNDGRFRIVLPLKR